jgi:hypothetical protein
MKLYVTYGSPYARLARIIIIEMALEDRVEIIEAKTRTPAVLTIRSIPLDACLIWSMILASAWKTANSSAAISTVGIVTVRNRTISPLAQSFIDYARKVTMPLAKIGRMP